MVQIKIENKTLNRITLKFDNQALNEQFNTKYFKSSIRSLRIALILVAFLYAIFGYFDRIVTGENSLLFFAIRYYFIVPLILLTYALSFASFFKIIWQYLLMFCFIAAGSGIVIMITETPDNYLYYNGLFLVFTAGFFFIRLRTFKSFISSISIILIYNLLTNYNGIDNDKALIYHYLSNAFFLSIILIATLASYHTEILEIREFLQIKKLNKQQTAIFQINNNLEKTIAERTQEIREAKERAEESDRLKTAFLENISHEIRTPMNGILGFTNLLKRPNLSITKQQQYVSIISNSGERLLRTVNNLIDISKIDAGQMEIQTNEFLISDALQNQVSFFNPDALEKKVELRLNLDYNPLITSDLHKVGVIFSNLVKNAIKYTENGTVNIKTSKGDNTVIVSISDTGIGIPEDRQKAVFNRFEQADIADEGAYAGTGLGLSLTKSYTEMLGGKIRLESTVDVGSTFYIELPLKCPQS